MSLPAAIFARLSTLPSVTDLIGTNPTRLFPDRVSDLQNQCPCVEYEIVTGPAWRTFDGCDGIRETHVQFRCMSAVDFDEAWALKEAVRLALQDWEDDVIRDSEPIEDVSEEPNEDIGIFSRLITFRMIHTEPKPS